MKRTLCTLLLTLLLLSALPPPAAQAAGTVAVSLPAFAVKIGRASCRERVYREV